MATEEEIQKSMATLQPEGEVCPHYSVVGRNFTGSLGAYIQECLVCKKRRTVTEWD